MHNDVTRAGVYGVVREENKILLVVQSKGVYAKRYDLPGGGIEFGETLEQTLRREFLEEIGMDFESMQLLTNLTTVNETYRFHQIGLIYSVRGLRQIGNGVLKYEWVFLNKIKEEIVSPFVWQLYCGLISH